MPSYKVTLEDGHSYKVTSDREMTNEQATAEARRQSGVQAAKPTPTPTPRVGRPEGQPRSTGTKVSAGIRDVFRGLADVPDSMAQIGYYLNPVNQVTELSDKILGTNLSINRPKPLARKIVDKAADVVKAGKSEEGSDTERTVGAGIRGGVSAAVPLPGMGKIKLAQTAIQGLAGALGGAGAEAADIAGLPPAVQAAIGLTAGVAVPSVAHGVGEAAAGVRHHLKGVSSGRGQAARQLQQAAADSANPNALDDAISSITNRPHPIGKTKPTLAETANNTGLSAMQRSQGKNPVIEQMADNAQQRARVASGTFGRGETGDVTGLAGRKQTGYQQAEQAAAEGINPTVESRMTTGTQAVQDYTTNAQAMAGRRTAAYNVPVLQAESPLQGTARDYRVIRGPIRDFRRNAGGDVPSEITVVIDDVRQAIRRGRMNTRVLTNVSARLGEIGGKAAAAQEHRVARLAGQLDNAITARFANRMPAGYQQALDNASALRLQEGQLFEQGNMGRIFGEKRFGEARVKPNEIGDELVTTGAGGGTIADEMIAALGAAPSERIARQGLRRLVEEGKAQQLAGSNFDELLGRFPGLKSDVAALNTAREQTAAFSKTQLGKLASGDADVQAKVSSLLGKADKSDFIQLRDQVMASNDHRAIAGLRRALAQHVEKAGATTIIDARTGTMIPKPAHSAIDEVLRATEGTQLINAKQRNVLTKLRDEMARARSAETGGKFVPGQEEIRGPNLPLETARKRIGFHLVYSWAQNHNAVDKLIQRAFVDPDFAAGLLQRKVPNLIQRWQRATAREAIGAARGIAPVLNNPVVGQEPAVTL